MTKKELLKRIKALEMRCDCMIRQGAKENKRLNKLYDRYYELEDNSKIILDGLAQRVDEISLGINTVSYRHAKVIKEAIKKEVEQAITKKTIVEVLKNTINSLTSYGGEE